MMPQTPPLDDTQDAPVDSRPSKRRGLGWKIASLLLIYLSLAATFNVVWRLLRIPPQMQHGVLNPGLMLLSGIILVASILTATALTVHFFENRPLATVGIPFSRLSLEQVLIGLAVGSIPPVFFFLVARALGDAQVSSTGSGFHRFLVQTLPALGSMLLLAFNEELFFRGYLLQSIAQRAGRPIAAIITGVLFGLVHSANSAANLPGLLFTAIGGVLLAWLVMRTGSVWMATGYHAGWNATASLVLGLSVSGTTTPGSWIMTTLGGPRWISGGSYGFESSIVAGMAEPLVLGCLVWLAPRMPSHSELRQYFDRRPLPRQTGGVL